MTSSLGKKSFLKLLFLPMLYYHCISFDIFTMAVFASATSEGFLEYAEQVLSRTATVLEHRSHDMDAVDAAFNETINLHRFFFNLEGHLNADDFCVLRDYTNDVLVELGELYREAATEDDDDEEELYAVPSSSPKPELTVESLRFFKRKGYSNVAIGQFFGVSRQTVHNKINKFGLAVEVNIGHAHHSMDRLID